MGDVGQLILNEAHMSGVNNLHAGQEVEIFLAEGRRSGRGLVVREHPISGLVDVD